jgi:hypothetical protein
MVTREQNVRYGVIPKDGRARVVGVFQQTLSVGILKGGRRIAQDARDQPGDSIDDDHGRYLTAREHIVPDRDLVADQVLVNPLVHAFIATADEQKPGEPRQLAGRFLAEGTALGG